MAVNFALKRRSDGVFCTSDVKFGVEIKKFGWKTRPKRDFSIVEFLGRVVKMGPKTRIRVWTKSKVNYRDYRLHIRAAIGALVGILITGYVSKAAIGMDMMGLPLLIAPMGASAVLLFAASSSPLAQPWNVVGGNTIAAFIGVFTYMWLKDPIAASGISVAASIGLMSLLGCLHPPSGAVALTAVLGGSAIHDLGYMFVVWPVGLNSVLLLIAALLFNNATGLRYPPRQEPVAPPSVAAPLPTSET